ncbi:CFA/I fimbrial subunit C usher protein [Raoultella ornithinolytica]|nr:CFA/I fimbrial subunit C usher protein [Raoultella ornithinolytica]
MTVATTSHYYTADYYQTLFSGAFGSLGLRAGIQRFNNGGGGSSSSTGKYIALDFSLPLGNWFSAGIDPPERLYDGKPFRP